MGNGHRAELATRFIKCADATLFSFYVLDYHFREINESVHGIVEQRSNIVRSISACWGFIDGLHRLREVCQSIPGVSQKESEFRFFLKETDTSEKFRHYVQHLNREISKVPPNPYPVWGSLSWVDRSDPAVTHVAMLGTLLGTTQYAGAVYDRLEKKWVSNVTLTVGADVLLFDRMYAATQRFRIYLEMLFSTRLTKSMSIDDFPIATVRVSLPESDLE